MDQNLIISVVIPAYNAEKTIIPCVESVLKQTFSVLEIIVVNDGSSDSTESVLTHYISDNNIPNIFVYTQANGGPSKARNFGVNKAKGSWIAFIDADDRWLPDKLDEQVRLVLSHPEFSIVGCEFSNFKAKKTVDFEQISLISMFFKVRIYTSTAMVKKMILERYKFDEEQRYSEDARLWIQIMAEYKAAVLLKGLVVYAENNQLSPARLSQQFWSMEKGELSNFIFFYKKGTIGLLLFVILSVYSLLKYCKRIILNKLKMIF